MKRKSLALFVVLLLTLCLSAGVKDKDFLSTAISVNASTTATNGSQLYSREFDPKGNQVAITVTFARAAGTADTVDVYFEASYDGTTWATFDGALLEIPTNTTPVTGTTVTVLYQLNVYGVELLRVWKVDNTDSSNGITACNITMSYGR